MWRLFVEGSSARVHLGGGAGAGIEAAAVVAVQRGVHDGRVVLQYVLRAVAVMHILHQAHSTAITTEASLLPQTGVEIRADSPVSRVRCARTRIANEHSSAAAGDRMNRSEFEIVHACGDVGDRWIGGDAETFEVEFTYKEDYLQNARPANAAHRHNLEVLQ